MSETWKSEVHFDILVSTVVESFQPKSPREVSHQCRFQRDLRSALLAPWEPSAMLWPHLDGIAPQGKPFKEKATKLAKAKKKRHPLLWLFGIKFCAWFKKVLIVCTFLDSTFGVIFRKISTLHMKLETIDLSLGPGYTRPARVHQRKTQDPKGVTNAPRRSKQTVKANIHVTALL